MWRLAGSTWCPASDREQPHAPLQSSVLTEYKVSAKNGPGGHCGQQAELDPAVHLSGDECQPFARLHCQVWGQWVKGSNYSPLLGIPVAASMSSFGDHATWKTVRQVQHRATKMIRVNNSRPREWGLFSLQKWRLEEGNMLAVFNYLFNGCRDSILRCMVKGWVMMDISSSKGNSCRL